jgi:pilus assembly protein FimV
MNRFISRAVGLSMLGIAGTAAALGFGRVPSSANLGQPLDISLPLRIEANEEIRPECISTQVQFGDSIQQPGVVTARLMPALPGATERILRIVTSTRVDEPVVSLSITAGCGSSVSRKFTLFADPPPLAPDTAVAVPSEAAQPAPPTPVPRSARRAAASGAPSPQRDQADQATLPSTSAAAPVAAASATAQTRKAASPPVQRQAAVARVQSSGAGDATRAARAASRLQLSPVEPALASSAQPQVEASVAQAEEAAASAAQAASAAALAVARMQQMEAALERLRSENEKTQESMKGLHARLQSAEAARYSNPLVYALGLLSALLAAGLVFMTRQRAQDRRAAAWLDQPSANEAATRAGARDTVQVPVVSSVMEVPPAPDYDAQVASAPQPFAAATQKREVSVEELIDLEQQAEFFVVLGQDEAAIDLLMAHLRGTSATSALPYLKLLEIFKRRGDRKEYERIRERFNSRFNAYAPAWDTELLAGRSLEDYPAIVERLQSIWSSPLRIMQTLQSTLVRAEEGAAGTDNFDLPAYRELLMLYSVARDLSENSASLSEPTPLSLATTASHDVDIMLPLGDEDVPLGERTMVFTPMIATGAMEARPVVRAPLEVDFDLDLPDAGEAQHSRRA